MVNAATSMRARTKQLVKTALGLVLATLVAYGLLPAILELVAPTSTESPMLTRYFNRFCSLNSFVFYNQTESLVRKIESDATVADTSSGPTIDFRQIDERWQTVCLTHVEDGEFFFSDTTRVSFNRLIRPVCWGWSNDYITLLLIDKNRNALPMKFNLSSRIQAAPVVTNYASGTSFDYRQCASRESAKAECFNNRSSAAACKLVFK